MPHFVVEALMSAILVSGLVVIMMMMIECLNIGSNGKIFKRLSKNSLGQVIIAALLGAVPGCMGGFAVVSLYTHSILSFGALVAMMIATMGDESFVMLAMFPETALWISLGLLALAVVVGVAIDKIPALRRPLAKYENCLNIHNADCCEDEGHCHDGAHHHGRHLGWRRTAMFLGVAVFIAALVFGILEHGDEEPEAGGLNLLSEEWLNYLFALLSIAVLAVLALGSDHFVEEHLWGHIIKKHLPRVFAWTFGTLLLLGTLMEFVDLSGWISDNVVLMVILAALIGIIPESGPHLVFVTLFASGILPFPVLLASCISQDGHAGLPLLAESGKTFLLAKAINVLIAIGAGLLCFWVL